MNKTKALERIKHAEIDSEKWNRCIDTALNSRIYSFDWHLDRTAIVWDALIWGDYEYVMPLPFRSKLGIKYLYQPIFSQQLGIFPSPPTSLANKFFHYISTHFRYSDVHINAENIPTNTGNPITFNARKNFLLSLSHPYQHIAANFSKNTKRNISKASKQQLSLVEGIRLEEYLRFKSSNLPTNISSKELAALKSLIALGQRKGFGKIYGVYTSGNELCAAAYFCRNKERLTYLSAATSTKGKELGGMYFLLDEFIQQNAGNHIIIDFEGSMIPGVARFYEGFGAKAERYFQLKLNRLPLFLKWVKQ